MPRPPSCSPVRAPRPSAWPRRCAERCPAAKALFDEASAVLGYDLLDVCANGPAERLNATDVSQPAIFVASLAALESAQGDRARRARRRASPTAGLSLGEYTALVVRRGADVRRRAAASCSARGEAMQAAAEATPSGMVSVLGLDVPEVEALCVEAAAAGHARGRQLLCPATRRLRRRGRLRRGRAAGAEEGRHRTVRLAVAGAFHTDADEAGRREAGRGPGRRDDLGPARAGLVERGRQAAHRPGRDPRRCWCGRCCQPVRWEETMRGPAGRRRRAVLRDRPGPGAGRAAQAGAPQGRRAETCRREAMRGPTSSGPMCRRSRCGLTSLRAGLAFPFAGRRRMTCHDRRPDPSGAGDRHDRRCRGPVGAAGRGSSRWPDHRPGGSSPCPSKNA